MNKICTTIEQSKKLIELGIDVATADMHYSTWTILNNGEYILSPNQGETIEELQEDYGNQVIPAWSLAALSEILKCCVRCEITLRNDKQWNIFATKDGNRFCSFEQRNSKGYDSQLDAYYDVVCWLKEHKFI